jgi:hypothetical protein
MLLDADGRPVRRVIGFGFVTEYRRIEVPTVEISTDAIAAKEIALEEDEEEDGC